MRLSEMTQSHQREKFAKELQAFLDDKLGDLSTDEWIIYALVLSFAPRNSGKGIISITLDFVEKDKVPGRKPDIMPDESMATQIVIYKIPKLIDKFYRLKTGKGPVFKEDAKKEPIQYSFNDFRYVWKVEAP
jgi:hypothetical protein